MYAENTTATGVPAGTNYMPQSHQPFQQNTGAWSSGLCDCFSDCSSCCLTCWCPCIAFGQIAEIVDKGSSSCGVNGALYFLLQLLIGYPCCYSCLYRSKMRKQFNLEESPCGDFLVHCFCEGCALCQEYRELKIRGFDVALGWQGNVDRENRGVAMAAPTAPVMEGGMKR
ncbi:hypothetical protein ACOSP7_019464 [Xanthoceras sorbifolium]|uniref:Uncharacterized protein n=1 Tax=Xanthoceras sorbifolium TaxID=99658 RepID=A0ABQ8I2S0_9ROSI|nr:hypothetical protein JRO89_XS05G0223800 [Xanthoceras sorbifolium]